tara:strand:- start:1093 stop:1410 length:318 start_codon:yes stop_codon:yes gene_type:complete
VKIVKMTKGDWGKCKAFFDLETADGFILKGFKLIDSDGLFVGFPSVKGKDGEYSTTVQCNKQLKQEVNKLAHDYYNGYTPEVVESLEQEAVSDRPDYADKDEIPF